MIIGKYPSLRLRRNRKESWSRRLIQENTLSPNDFILPIFLIEGSNKRQEISSMPGVYRYTINRLSQIVDRAIKKKIPMVALFPKTGRTHQLRVHLEYINAPIVGDNKYRGLSEIYTSSQNLPEHKKLSQIKWIPNNIKNLQLHAYSIRIPESETITAEVSEDFKKNLKFLGLKLPKKLQDIFI